jgi:hypothetical protein
MNEDQLTAEWAQFELSAEQRHHIENRVLEWLEAGDTSLVAQWVGLIRFDPAASLGYAAAGAISLFFITPLSWFVGSIIS